MQKYISAKNYAVQEYAKKLGIILVYMPPYSPNLCLIERLWKFFNGKELPVMSRRTHRVINAI